MVKHIKLILDDKDFKLLNNEKELRGIGIGAHLTWEEFLLTELLYKLKGGK